MYENPNLSYINIFSIDTLNKKLVEEYSLMKEFFNSEIDQTLKDKKNIG